MQPSLENVVNPPIKQIIQLVSSIGKENNQEVYLVGGFVRDLYLKRGSDDLDFVIIGSPNTFARQLIEQKHSNTTKFEICKEHPNFGTMTLLAVIENSISYKLDLATARTEIYPSPAELPVVKPAKTIDEDICRRGNDEISYMCSSNLIFRFYN